MISEESEVEAGISGEPDVPARSRKAGGIGGFLVLLFGGILAAAIGWLVASFDPETGWFSEPGRDELAELRGDMSAAMDALEKTEATLALRTEEIEQLRGDLERAGDRIAALDRLDAGLAETGGALSGLQTRLADLENRPIPDIGATQDAVAAYERELAAMRQMFAAELDRIEAAQRAAEARQDDAAATGRQATVMAALARLDMAAATGAALGPLLEELAASGVTIPSELAAVSGGVTALAELGAQFPDAARQAIDADIRQRADTGEIGRVSAFIRLQLGQRSLAPRAGDDADAVLSRAEAALRAGDVGAAIGQIEPLGGLDAPLLAAWVKAATRHQEVRQAISALAAEFGS